eukprot:103745_1
METTETDRKNWVVGSPLQIFVESRNKWYSATVTEIYTDDEGEWLMVSIQNKILFELNSFDHNLRRHKTKEEIEAETKEKERIQREKEEKEESKRIELEKQKLELILRRKSEYDKLIGITKDDTKNEDNDSDDDISTDYYTESDESSSISSSSSIDSLDSIDSKDDTEILNISEDIHDDPALIVIIIDRAGTFVINGKYTYKGSQRGQPLWQKETDIKCKLWYKYDNLWTIEYDNNDLYIAYTLRILPPSSGWEAVDDAKYPSPSVILHRLNQIETIKNYVTGTGFNNNNNHEKDNNSFSPLEMIEYDFEIGNVENDKYNIEKQFGFSLYVNDITGLMYVKHVVLDSQAYDMGLQVDDVVSNIEDDDISLFGDVNKLYKYLKNEMNKQIKNENSFIIITFG